MSMTCELCGHAGRMLPFYPSHGLEKCPRCDLVFYHDPAAAAGLYTREYFAGGEYHDYVADKPILQRNFRRRISELLQLAPAGRLLEIGSAYGFFLELARRHWDVRGIEIVPDGVQYTRQALGVPVECGDVLDLPDERDQYDLICMWDTIEHLKHPVRTVEKVGRWLKPGGHLIITTGDIDSWLSRRRKHRWRLIHPPTHLYYFSPRTLARAVGQAGLNVHRIARVGYSRSSKSMLYAMLMGKRKRRLLYWLLTVGERLDVPVYLNLYDIMMMVAQKPRPAARRPGC